MRNPNGFGTVKKLKGNRRRPYAAYVPVREVSEAKDISFLRKALDPELFQAVSEQYAEYCQNNLVGRKTKQRAIGYYATHAEANNALTDYNRNPFDIDKRNTTFGQIYEILYNEKFSRMKKQAKSSYVTAFKKCGSISGIRMIELRKNHMQRILDENSEMSKSSIANIIKLFRAVFNFALENDICEKDYSQFVESTSEKKAKEKRPFTKEEINILWDNLGRKNLDTILIMVYSGMRIGELLKIRKKDINLEERYIELHGTKTKAADRIVPIHKKIIPLLEKRMAETENWLFKSSNRDTPISYTNYKDKHFNIIMNELNMNHTPHECRHSFITYATEFNFDQILLMKIVGHSAQNVTQDTYTHAKSFVEKLVKEIDKYGL